MQPEHLRFIARIYDVALDPGCWPSVLDELSFHTGAKAANCLVTDRFLPEVQVTQGSSYFDEKIIAHWLAEYARYEVGGLQELMRHPAQVWVEDEVLLGAQFGQIPSTLWMKREQGIFRRACARLNTNKGWFDVLTLNMAANRGQITPAEARVGSLFLPHLAKAVEIGRSFQVLRSRFHTVLEALDRFHLGVILLGPLGSRHAEEQRGAADP